MKTSKEKIKQETKEVYFAIKQIMEQSGYDYCQSWWLNSKNFQLKSKLSTPKINQRAKLLIKMGYLTINPNITSTSQGTSYRLTNKKYQNEFDGKL